MLARHYREAEGLSIAQIAQRLGRAPGDRQGAISTTPTARRPEPSSAATRGCAAAAARPPRRATARATPTSTARPATPERSPPGGQPHECATRCAPGNTATAASPPHTTGRAPTPAAAALKRSNDSTMASGRPPASSATCSAPGKPRARPPAPTHKPTSSDHPRRPIPYSAAAAGGRAAHDRSSRTHLGRLGRVLERADRLGAGRFRAAPWWAPLAVAGHPGRFGSRNAGPQAFPGTGPILRDPPPPQDASARTHPASSQRPPHRSECR